MRTPPYKVLLAHLSGDPALVAAKLVASISKKEPVIPGMIGDRELTDSFMKTWCRKHGVAVQGTMAERLYRLVRVNNVPISKGRFRPATEADADLVARWMHSFNIDTFGTNQNLPESDITPGIAKGDIFLWEDSVPVSMAVKNRPTDKGMAVGYVYTPPELRRRGYATSCVAELCRNILQSGYRFCTLYADLANPTSNSIYKKIGFREVCDSVDYTLTVEK
jgi:predicted GNAT family acetyltransferase